MVAKTRDTGWIIGSGRSPGEGNATHSSILAWEIPWREEPGGLWSMESQSVEHPWWAWGSGVLVSECGGGQKRGRQM